MFDKLQGLIWLDGQILKWTDARIHIMTHALHYASSVYEGIRSYNNKLFKAKEHYQRLHVSARYLDFQIPYSTDELIKATEDLLKMQEYKEGYIRAISWCGSNVMTVSHNNANVHTAIAIWERPIDYTQSLYTKGIRMSIADWKRPDPSTAPVHSKAAGLYMTSSMSKKTSELLGFEDALMLDYEGYIAEATSSNVFLVMEDKIFTPIANCFLNGITRKTIIELAKKLDIEVFENKLILEDFDKTTEVFLTGTAIEILPVKSIEGLGKKWSFKPATITSTLRTEFKKITENRSR